MSKQTDKGLREGFTTGTAAAAAAKAATVRLLGGECPAQADVPLPNGARLAVAVASCRKEGGGVRAEVVKDGGDDPDVTHGAVIQCLVGFGPEDQDEPVAVDGGLGVGLVTKPGLPVAPGQKAINPEPRIQIAKAVAEAARAAGSKARLRVLVEVPEGEKLAARTMNPRLGIEGGISILGTRGTVKPFSHDAYLASIEACLRAARAQGADHAALTTGGRSERLLKGRMPHLPEQAFVPVADNFAFAVKSAAAQGFTRATWGVFFGKLVKQAQGHANTHAKFALIDFNRLADDCRRAGADRDTAEIVAGANTAQQVLEAVSGLDFAPALFADLARRASEVAERFAGGGLAVDHVLFDLGGEVLHPPKETGRD